MLFARVVVAFSASPLQFWVVSPAFHVCFAPRGAASRTCAHLKFGTPEPLGVLRTGFFLVLFRVMLQPAAPVCAFPASRVGAQFVWPRPRLGEPRVNVRIGISGTSAYVPLESER